MHHRLSRTLTIIGLILLLGGGLGWASPPNPTPSDAQGNTAGGTNALQNNTGTNNTAFGDNALQSNTTGGGNTASGADALYSNTTGIWNTASGAEALYSNTTGFANTASGVWALYSNTTGYSNAASGVYALYSNTTGYENATSGVYSLYSNTTGSNNAASGEEALYNNTTGSGNTAHGSRALGFNTTGNENTASGNLALYNLNNGNDNLAVGARAGINLTSGDYNIYLGNPGVPTESNTMRLGDVGTQTHAFMAGVFGTHVDGGTPVFINSAGQLGTPHSSARYKSDIQTMGKSSHGLLQLRPVTFRYTQDAQGVRQYGLIAEEVAKVYPELVVYSASGEIESVQYQALIPMLLNEVQHQQQAFSAQARQVADLKAQNARLQKQLQERYATQQAQNAALTARLERLEAAAARAATLASR